MALSHREQKFEVHEVVVFTSPIKFELGYFLKDGGLSWGENSEHLGGG
jgi:hypothetical protein